ncbi:serine/threonine-protein phosphatase 4 regulatory subunit 4-like isoform X2 [Xenia sp. Carnegie-2017]|uniref:serine/threonine-protein phosphatase 4 regulatory subunit 4-like isoform X2 n=1 Tax=Xenia sp. Carnegie-2017 TaxID=2897299 RepID=UPI001F04774E|nr:serine/threonine-protein phosphatase 4 regulatory subunit 4-like isoform X2 [Xenia sp. Carnegie-2017]
MQHVKLFNRTPAILLLTLLNIIFLLPGMDWLNRGLASFEQNEMYGDFGELKEEEVEELRSERTIKSGLKSEEEIQRLTVDENLSDVERAVFLLSSGIEAQKLSVINNLPLLFENHANDAVKEVMPLVRELLYAASVEIQLVASKSYYQIIERGLLPIYAFISAFLPTILNNMENKDPTISHGWLNALLCTITKLPKDAIKREILPIAFTKGQLSQSVTSRLSCCKILGVVVAKFDPLWIKKELMGLITSLCQDVDYEVRACMSHELQKIGKDLGGDFTKSWIMPELVELTNDEESIVRLAAIETIAELLHFLNDENSGKTIVPLVQNFCELALKRKKDDTLIVVSKLFGKLCYGLNGNFTDTQKKWCVEYFQKLCSSGLKENKNKINHFQRLNAYNESLEESRCAEIRKNCAFNFPAMVAFCGAEDFTKDLASCFHALVTDRNFIVRRSVSCGFHEVIKLLGSKAQCLQSELHILLMDETVPVLEGLILNLNVTLSILSNGGRSNQHESKLNNLSELIPPVIACEHTVSQCMNWRIHEQLLRKFSAFIDSFTSDQIYYKFTPVLFDVLHRSHVLPVTHAAAYTLCIFLRNNARAEQRDEMCCRFIEECGKGKSYRDRLLFMKICTYILELFSRKFFKEHFFAFFLELVMDPVINIRLHFCHLLPKLKSVLKLPMDRSLLQRLELCVRQLLNDEKDPDVCAAVREAALRLDKIEIVMETSTHRSMFEEDLVDQKKEEEEALMEAKERNGISFARQGSDKKKKTSLKEEKVIKKGGAANIKKYCRQDAKKSSNKECKTVVNKAGADLASCSYLYETNPTITSSKKSTSGGSLGMSKSSHSMMTQKASTASKKNSSIPMGSRPGVKAAKVVNKR